ncbi:MAG TPA: hypothetical protein PKC72_05335 [Chitinophagaceae bacterium]|nr:hypothetical protein [Chitinophagaceae bacterium]
MKHQTKMLAIFIAALFSQVTIAQQIYPVSLSANSGALNGGSDRYGRPAPDMGAWTDPALNHNKLLQQQVGEGVYKLIGPYKVVGNEYLFGVHNKGDMFTPEAKAFNIFLSYNTYSQEVEFYSSSNPDEPLIREPGTVDSFYIQENPEKGISRTLKFIYGSHIGTKDKSYYMELYNGDRFILFKKYKSDLGYVSSNLGQSELRRFDLGYEYYYFDNSNKKLKKIKPNASDVIKEFKSVKDLSEVIKSEDFSYNPEAGLKKAFGIINTK